MSQYRDDAPIVSDDVFTVSLPTHHVSPSSDISNQGVLWSGTAISLSFVLFRVFIRIRAFQKLFVDDALVVLAWLLLLTTAVLWSIEKSALYLQYDVTNGVVALTPDVSKSLRDFNWSATALEITFYLCLWSIKLSFLMFVRRLGEHVTGLRLLWWLVAGLVITSFFTCIGVIPYRCLIPPLEVLNGTSHRTLHIAKRKLINYRQTDALPHTQTGVVGQTFITRALLTLSRMQLVSLGYEDI